MSTPDQLAEADTRLSVSYDGPALATGRMDAKVLAGAMASVAQLVDDSARLIHGADTNVRIEVSGDFRRGSFTYQIIATALSDLTAVQVKEILVWLGLIATTSGGSLISVLRWLRGRRVRKVSREGNQATITAGNDSTIVQLQVAQLVMNYPIRTALEGMTQPLAEAGITTLRTGEDIQAPDLEIQSPDREWFLAPAVETETLHSAETVAVLQIVSPVFKIGNKWQFSYPGEPMFYALILDRQFLDQAKKREVSLRWGDLVRVRLRTSVARTQAGTLSTTREILEVIEIVPPPEQFNIFPPADPEDSAER